MFRRLASMVGNQWAGFLALFLVLTGGTAMAVDGSLPGQNTVGSADIINGEVTQDDVAANSVGTGKITDGGIKNQDLSAGASSSNTIADGGIEGVDVKDNTLKGADIDEAQLDAAIIQRRIGGSCDPGSTIRTIAANGTVTCHVDGGGPPSGDVPEGGDLTGSYPAPEIAPDAIGSGEIGKLTNLEFRVSTFDPLNPFVDASISFDPPFGPVFPAELNIDAPSTRFSDSVTVDGGLTMAGGAAANGEISAFDGVFLGSDSTLDIEQAAPGSVPTVPANSDMGRIYVRSNNGNLELVVRWKGSPNEIDVLATGPADG